MSGEGIGIGSNFEKGEGEPDRGTAVDGVLAAIEKGRRQETTASAIAHMKGLSSSEIEPAQEETE